MKQKYVYRILFFLVIIATAIVWLVSVATESFTFDVNWFVFLVLGGIGVLNLIRGITNRSGVYIVYASILLACAVLPALNVFEVVKKASLALPIIGIILAMGGIFTTIAVASKPRWDKADNETK